MHFTLAKTSQSLRTRVKICGITRAEDALTAADAGADAVGLVFYAKSPRAVSVAQAKTIAQQLPPLVTIVALFVNPSAAEVHDVLQHVPVDLLQFHGDESSEFCRSFAKPFIKAVRVKAEGASPALAGLSGSVDDFVASSAGHARGVLLDAWSEQHYGGTGHSFDWQTVKQIAGSARIILAGGLKPANVAQAIRIAQPWAVDVSSGVEQAPGIKSAQLIQEFISEVQRV